MVLLTILIGNVVATPFVLRDPPLQQISFGKPLHNPKLDTCKLCINFADQFINELLNIILSKPVQNSEKFEASNLVGNAGSVIIL